MKRIINIFSDAARVHIPNSDSVDVSRLDETINCSVDTIFAYILEYIKPEFLDQIMAVLLNKLRLDGNLILRFADIKKICELYIKNEITDKEFLSYTLNKTNILSVDKIIAFTNDKFIIGKIDFIDNHIIIILQRKSL